jgi:hypothetical protein
MNNREEMARMKKAIDELRMKAEEANVESEQHHGNDDYLSGYAEGLMLAVMALQRGQETIRAKLDDMSNRRMNITEKAVALLEKATTKAEKWDKLGQAAHFLVTQTAYFLSFADTPGLRHEPFCSVFDKDAAVTKCDCGLEVLLDDIHAYVHGQEED